MAERESTSAQQSLEEEWGARYTAAFFVIFFLGYRWLILEVSGGLELAYVPACATMAALAVASSRFYRRWLFWRPRPAEASPGDSILLTGVAVFGVVETFTVAAIVFVRHGWLHVGGYHSGLPSKFHLAAGIERDFLWNALDAVPGLDLPSTLNWAHPAHPLTGYTGGVMLLMLKVLVIIPSHRSHR